MTSATVQVPFRCFFILSFATDQWIASSIKKQKIHINTTTRQIGDSFGECVDSDYIFVRAYFCCFKMISTIINCILLLPP